MDAADTTAVVSGVVGLTTLLAERRALKKTSSGFPWRAAGVVVAGGVLGGALAFALAPRAPLLSAAVGGFAGSYGARYLLAGREPPPSVLPNTEPAFRVPDNLPRPYAPSVRLWGPMSWYHPGRFSSAS